MEGRFALSFGRLGWRLQDEGILAGKWRADNRKDLDAKVAASERFGVRTVDLLQFCFTNFERFEIV